MSQSYLPPESQRWGRDIEDRLKALEIDQRNAGLALKANAVTLGGLQATNRVLEETVIRARDNPGVFINEDSQMVLSGVVPDLYVSNVIGMPEWANSARYTTFATFAPYAYSGSASVRGIMVHYSDIYQVSQAVAIPPTSTLADASYPISATAVGSGAINQNATENGQFEAYVEAFVTRTGSTVDVAGIDVHLITIAVFDENEMGQV